MASKATQSDVDGAAEKLRQKLAAADKSSEQAAYKVKRQQLLDEELATAWYLPALNRAGPLERKANGIVIHIREQDRLNEDVFGERPSEEPPARKLRDLGGRFLVNKDRIDRSRLFDIAKHMPKGAHLHLHFNSELPPERILPEARKLEATMYIRSTMPLHTKHTFDQTEIVFEVLPSDTPEYDLFSPTYDPGSKMDRTRSWMKWSSFRSAFPRSISLDNIYIEAGWGGGTAPDAQNSPEVQRLDNAERWAREKMLVTRKRAYHDRQTTNGAWACFNQGTRAFKGLINVESVYRWYIGQMIQSLIDDKIMYAELRPMLLDKDIPSDDGKKKLNHHRQMSIVCEEVQRKRDALAKVGMEDLFPFGLKIIYCTPRSIPRAIMEKELQDCLKLKLQFPDLICGFDLVGAEDREHHIGFYADLLLAFAATCSEQGVSIPFMFHAGETLLDTGGSSEPGSSNLYDAMLLKSKRVGHGYSLLKHPTLVEGYKKHQICLEVCPTSNEILHLCGNVRQHRLPELLAAGLHCTLNADNPNLFSNSLSHEFYQAMVGDPRMNLHGWKQLSEWSIEYACLTQHERALAQEIFSRQWEDFCGWIVETHASALVIKH